MSFFGLNDVHKYGFTEWRAAHLDRGTVPPTAKTVPDGKEPIRTVTKAIYRRVFNASKGDGYYDVKSVTDNLVQWDYFRVRLPRLTNQVRGSRIAHSMKGADPVTVGQRVWSAAAAPGGAAPMIPVSAQSPNDYLGWVNGEIENKITEAVNGFIPVIVNARYVAVLRWPQTYYRRAWVGTAVGNVAMILDGDWTSTLGMALGDGRMFFFSATCNDMTFKHELGHSLHLVHFMVGYPDNTAWKQHDHRNPDCVMGYGMAGVNTRYSVPNTANQAGVVPALELVHNLDRTCLCAKCLLKLRGWNDEVLPCDWDEPRVF
jgi:hypothetical protein